MDADGVPRPENQLIRRFPFDQTEGNPENKFPGNLMSAASSKARNNQSFLLARWWTSRF